MTRSFTREEARTFMVYLNVADELWPTNTSKLTLDDIDRASVREAKLIAFTLGLPWPPDMAEAEEYVLTHGPALRHAMDWTLDD